jgi:hypothetical protein
VLATEVLEKKNPAALPYKCAQFLLYMFFCMHRAEWLRSEADEQRKASEAATAEHIARFGRYFADFPKDAFAEVYMTERARTFAGNVETETFDAWMTRIVAGREGEEGQ